MQANLLRVVSHDLRTPLITIYGASSALLENGEQLTVKQREMILQGIREDSDWLMRMVENAVLHAKGMKNLSLRVFASGKQAVFEIADNGCGITNILRCRMKQSTAGNETQE